MTEEHQVLMQENGISHKILPEISLNGPYKIGDTIEVIGIGKKWCINLQPDQQIRFKVRPYKTRVRRYIKSTTGKDSLLLIYSGLCKYWGKEFKLFCCISAMGNFVIDEIKHD